MKEIYIWDTKIYHANVVRVLLVDPERWDQRTLDKRLPHAIEKWRPTAPSNYYLCLGVAKKTQSQ